MSKAVGIQQRWIQDVIDGKEEGAYNLYKMYSKAMYNTLIRLLGDREEAKDVLQEAFIRVFNNIESYRAEAAFGAWVKRIVINAGLEVIRARKQVFQELQQEHDITEQEDGYPQIGVETIQEGIKSLPDGCRTVLSLYLFEGFTHTEIAEELRITVSTSKTQYMRGKQLLREKLKHLYYER